MKRCQSQNESPDEQSLFVLLSHYNNNYNNNNNNNNCKRHINEKKSRNVRVLYKDVKHIILM